MSEFYQTFIASDILLEGTPGIVVTVFECPISR